MRTDSFDQAVAIVVAVAAGAAFGGWQQSAHAGGFMLGVGAIRDLYNVCQEVINGKGK